MSPSDSGATMAGQMKRRNTKAPTAVYLAFGKRDETASDIYSHVLLSRSETRFTATHDTAYSSE